MSDELLRQTLFPFHHQAQLPNAVTGFATGLGSIMPLLRIWFYNHVRFNEMDKGPQCAGTASE